MVVIRLARGGTKKRPFFHLVVTNSRSTRDGRFIERLGFYNPIATGGEIKLQLHKDRFDYWTSKGAQPSARVLHLVNNFAEIAASSGTKKPVENELAAEEAHKNNKKSSHAEKKEVTELAEEDKTTEKE